MKMAVHWGGRVDDSQGDAAGGDRGAEPLGARFRAEPVRRFADAVRLCSDKKKTTTCRLNSSPVRPQNAVMAVAASVLTAIY